MPSRDRNRSPRSAERQTGGWSGRGSGGGGVPAGGVAGGAVEGSEGVPNDTPGAPGSKLTFGTPSSPRRASSTSKNSSSSKLNMFATTFDGTDWTRRV